MKVEKKTEKNFFMFSEKKCIYERNWNSRRPVTDCPDTNLLEGIDEGFGLRCFFEILIILPL